MVEIKKIMGEKGMNTFEENKKEFLTNKEVLQGN